MRLGMAIVALGSVLIAGGATAMPLSPGTPITGDLEQLGAVLESVHYRKPRELSHGRYLGAIPYDSYRNGSRAGGWYRRGGVGVYRQPPGTDYTRRIVPYAYGDTFGFWPDKEPPF